MLVGRPDLLPPAGTVTASSLLRDVASEARALPGPPRRRPWRLVERNVVASRRLWYVFASGFLEPLLYLFSIGIGVGALVGTLPGPNGPIPYDVFVAPALMAVAAMNGAVLDTTFGFFVKYKYGHLYDAILATPMGVRDVARGEVRWALLRGTAYAGAFVAAMAALGLVSSWWAVLTLPASILIGFAFAGAGLAATTYMRSFVDFDYVNLVTVPMFLFSATFFPLARYPEALQWLVRATPLYQGVAIQRALVLGAPTLATVAHALYLAAMGAIGVRIAIGRLGRLLQP